MKRSALLLTLCLTILATETVHAQRQTGVIDQRDAQRAGLKVNWTTSVEVDPSYSTIAGMYLYVSDKTSTTTFEIEYGGTDEVKGLLAMAKDGDANNQRIALDRLAVISSRHFGQRNTENLDDRAKAYMAEVNQAATVREVISQYDFGPNGAAATR